jgi:hypothetical protein
MTVVGQAIRGIVTPARCMHSAQIHHIDDVCTDSHDVHQSLHLYAVRLETFEHHYTVYMCLVCNSRT